ncbi:hypothetical protein FKW77_009297 [Venturia effusa]|uniref:Poly(A) RNA polymerase mitochondrial-like central palm domain-containing protein n=1 Tax=Venturia effusa TaxID=50376 RepID=A0A517L811_9PEZI|nr:hypothetical protein FKW77_009297 [Venturia effusa]
MPIARCSLRCGSSNAFRPQQALCSLFLEHQQPLVLSNARRINLTHRKLQNEQPAEQIPPADAGTPITKNSPIPPSEYVNTSSLQDSLQTLRRKNRENILSQEHASSNEPHSNEKQPEENKDDALLRQRLSIVYQASMPKFTMRPQPASSKAEIITKQKKDHTPADTLEYTGMYVRPSMGEAVPGQEYPWTKDIPDDLQGSARLDAEIWRFSEYIKPTPAEQAACKAVTEDVQRFAKKYCGGYQTQSFGSQASGLALSTSDIDVRLYNKESENAEKAPSYTARMEMRAQVMHLHGKFSLMNSDYIMVRCRNARYPLISMLHKESGLDVQIVAGNNTAHSQKLVQQYLAEYPYLYAIYTLMRSMLDIRGLTDVFRGGLGSYSVIMMIVAALKATVKDPAHDSAQVSSGQPLAGKRFLDMLRFYAVLDTYKTALSLEHPFMVDKHDNLDVSEAQMAEFAKAPHLEGLNKLALIDHMQPYLLCLQDPADPLNDLGRKGYGWKHIQTTIKVLRGAISQAMSLNALHANGNPKVPIQSVLARAVGPCFKAYEVRRAMTEAYGQKILDRERAKKEKAERKAEKKAVAAELGDS